MPFKSLVENLVSNAFVIIDDLAVSAIYHVEDEGQYDPSTSENTRVRTDHVIKESLFAKFTQKEMESDEDINGKSDAKLLFPLKDQTFVINDNDTVSVKGFIWDIQKAKGVPGDSLGILHIRKR